MALVKSLRILLVVAVLVLAGALPAQAQERRLEVGTSLMSLMVGFGTDSVTVLGVPSGGFGILNPGLYVSVFLTPQIAVEPQLGLIAVSGAGSGGHVISLAGQVDYFLNGTGQRSPYVFGAIGVLSISDAGVTPKSIGVGMGYRMPLGDRLTMRFDGRITHFTDEGGNVFAITVSLGGMFGRK